MSDLQCPARFLVVGDLGEELLSRLRGERVVVVYDASADRHAGATETVARALGVTVRPLARPIDVPAVLSRRAEVLGELRDLSDVHRGETVLVLATGRGTDVLEVLVDADGSAVRPWEGARLEA